MKLLKCDQCPFQSNKITSLKTHKLLVHSDLRPWKCTHPGCSSKFKLKGNLKSPVKLHESHPLLRKPCACTFKDCDYRASCKSSLNSHVQHRHTPGRTRNFPCTLCPSRFYKKFNLSEHIGNHVKEKVFECNFCKYKTHARAYLGQHFRNFHEKRAVVSCSFAGCYYVTHSNTYLFQHMKRHNPDPAAWHPIPCPFAGCKHRARRRSHLK